LKALFPQKQFDQSFTRAAIAKPLITENNTKQGKDGVMIIKPGHLMIGNM